MNLKLNKKLVVNKKMTAIAFKNTMEELVGLRTRLLAEAYQLVEDDCFIEEAYEAVKDSSIYHIIYEYDGEIEYLNFKKNFETHYKYGYISYNEYKFLSEL